MITKKKIQMTKRHMEIPSPIPRGFGLSGSQHCLKEVLIEKDDRCTIIAKRKYDTWPSAYASGAVVRCRRGEIWKGQK